MISTRHLDTYSLPNLLINGGFDHLETVGDNFVPHFWKFGDVAPPDPAAKNPNCYIVTQNKPLTRKEDVRDYLTIKLATKLSATMTQSFMIDSGVALDFPIPLAPQTEAVPTTRKEVAFGYLGKYDRFLARSSTFSLGVSLQVMQGSATITAAFLDSSGAPITTATLTSSFSAQFTKQKWRRYVVKMTPEYTPAAIKLTITRANTTEYLELNMGNMQLVCGAYDDVPYTGDRLLSAIPKNAIVMSMGTSCPPGFVELENPEATLPDGWLAQDPTLTSRKNLFPIGATSVDPTALVGDPSHNRDSYKFTLRREDVVPLESFDSVFGNPITSAANNSSSGTNTTTAVGYASGGVCPGDEANEDGSADHQHNVAAGGSIPVNRSLRFCRKL